MKMLKSLLVMLTVIGLSGCGKTEQEVRHDEVVKAQALGCIDSNTAVTYETDGNMQTKNLIDVCFEKEKQRKAEVYKKEETERQTRLAQIQKEQQQLALEQQRLQSQQAYNRPIAPGEYQNRIGDTQCGFWNSSSQWEWYSNMSECKEETDNYLAYGLAAGLIGAEVIDELFDKRSNYKYNTYKPYKVKDYYNQNGQVVNKSVYQKDYNTYNQRKTTTVSGYKKESKNYDSNVYGSSSTKNKPVVQEVKQKKYDSNVYGTSSTKTKPVVQEVKQKKYDSNVYGASSTKTKPVVQEVKQKKYDSNVYGTSSTKTKPVVQEVKQVKQKNYDSNIFGNQSKPKPKVKESKKNSSSYNTSSKKSSSYSSSSKSSSSRRK